MLKETPKSLRLYFAFIAAISLLPIATAVVRGQFSALVSWDMLVNLVFGVAFATIAVRFHQLLRNPAPIKAVLIVSMISMLISFTASLRGGLHTPAVIALILSFLIFVYLMRSVTRLSKEAHATQRPPPPA